MIPSKANAPAGTEALGRTRLGARDVAGLTTESKQPLPMSPTEARREAFRILRDSARSMRRSVHEVERLLALAEGGPL